MFFSSLHISKLELVLLFSRHSLIYLELLHITFLFIRVFTVLPRAALMCFFFRKKKKIRNINSCSVFKQIHHKHKITKITYGFHWSASSQKFTIPSSGIKLGCSLQNMVSEPDFVPESCALCLHPCSTLLPDHHTPRPGVAGWP